MSHMIDVRDLEFGYSSGEFEFKVPALGVAAGERVVLTGPSGCGKTTLVHLLAGILEARVGVVEIAGLDMAAIGAGARHDLRVLRIGLIFREFELLEYLDVLDNVMLHCRLASVLVLDADARDCARSLVSAVSRGDKLHRFPDQLS